MIEKYILNDKTPVQRLRKQVYDQAKNQGYNFGVWTSSGVTSGRGRISTYAIYKSERPDRIWLDFVGGQTPKGVIWTGIFRSKPDEGSLQKSGEYKILQTAQAFLDFLDDSSYNT